MATPNEDAQVQAQARLTEIEELIKRRAPRLRPQVVPRPFQAVVENVLSACSTMQQRVEAEAFLKSKASEVKAVEGKEGLEEPRLVLDSELDLTSRTFRVTGAKFVEKLDAELYNLESFMELQLSAAEGEMEPYVTRFAGANGWDESVEQGAAVQDVYSLAYAMTVAISHMQGWTGHLGRCMLPLGEDVRLVEVLEELLQPESTPLANKVKKAAGKVKKKKGAGASKGGGVGDDGKGGGAAVTGNGSGKGAGKAGKSKGNQKGKDVGNGDRKAAKGGGTKRKKG